MATYCTDVRDGYRCRVHRGDADRGAVALFSGRCER